MEEDQCLLAAQEDQGLLPAAQDRDPVGEMLDLKAVQEKHLNPVRLEALWVNTTTVLR
jgi:hypothetical protein